MPHDLEQDLRHVLEYTTAVWEQLAGANIFIAGGSGFVGSWLLESFAWANAHLKLNARATVLTRNPSRLRVAGLDILHGDLQTISFPAKEFQFVIHAATESVEGTRRMLEMARAHGTRRFLFTSSGAVYGEQPSHIQKIDEDFAGVANTAYGQAKKDSEFLCAKAANLGLGVAIARLFALTGPYLPLDANFAAGNFVRDARTGGPIRIEGDGTPFRSYLYAADLAIWLWTLLVKGVSARPYNVGSDQAISILDLAKTVERVCGVERGIVVSQTAEPGAEAKRYVPSIERARSELGVTPLIPLEEGIRRMFQFSMK
jgi:dTDP-glucose 4,6-dehydratase